MGKLPEKGQAGSSGVQGTKARQRPHAGRDGQGASEGFLLLYFLCSVLYFLCHTEQAEHMFSLKCPSVDRRKEVPGFTLGLCVL